MATSAVRSELDGAVLRVVLDRPDRRNAFDAALIAELTEAFRQAPASGARCVVLAGEGRTFSAGADLEWMRGALELPEDANRDDALRLADLFAEIAGCPLPVVARVHGPALGGGAGLVCAADVAVLSEDAVIGFPEVRLGILPAVISPYVVRRIGGGAARALFLTGRAVDAGSALRLGLADAVAPADALDGAVAEVVHDLLLGSPAALAAVKELVDAVAGPAPAALREETARRIAAIRVGDEAQAGIRAFLERSRPPWAPREGA
jgi:methylglutaconyl-CoA hydratase